MKKESSFLKWKGLPNFYCILKSVRAILFKEHYGLMPATWGVDPDRNWPDSRPTLVKKPDLAPTFKKKNGTVSHLLWKIGSGLTLIRYQNCYYFFYFKKWRIKIDLRGIFVLSIQTRAEPTLRKSRNRIHNPDPDP